MRVADFDFELPDELIAQHPAPPGGSRLLCLDRRTGRVEHTTVGDLPRFFRSGDVLVVNNTRVFAARLLGHRVPSGGAVECLLIRRHDSAPKASDTDHNTTPSTPGTTETWSALMHPGQKLKPGAVVRFAGLRGALLGTVMERHFHGRRTIQLRAESGGTVGELIDALGHVPLPPYIRRADTEADRERYQTIFAAVRGSVAAPTAGLHFTPVILDALSRCRVERVNVTLHIGYGTFKPVRTDVVEAHTVDPEHYHIEPMVADTINRARDEGRRVIAVGTTTTRALEDAAIRGAGRVLAGAGEAKTFIYPGFHFQVVDGMMTNFHLPRSSLLMLVAAFAGREHVLAGYREAIALGYRFYSYGDAMLIL